MRIATILAVVIAVHVACVPPVGGHPPATDDSVVARDVRFWCAVSPNGKTLAFVRGEDSLVLMDLEFRKETLTLRTKYQVPTAITFSPDGRRVVIIFVDGEIQIVDAHTGTTISTFVDEKINRKKVDLNFMALSSDGQLAAFACYTLGFQVFSRVRVVIRDTATGRIVKEFKIHSYLILGHAFIRNDDLLIATYEGRFKRLQITNGKRASAHYPSFADLSDLSIQADGRVAAAGVGEAVIVFDPATGRLLQSISLPKEHVYRVAISPDGLVLAVATTKIKLFDVTSGKLLATCAGHGPESLIYTRVFFGNPMRLMTTGNDFSIRVWSVPPRGSQP